MTNESTPPTPSEDETATPRPYPTVSQLEEALEERVQPDRREKLADEHPISSDRRRQDRRKVNL